MRRHDIASTLMRRCRDVMCLLGKVVEEEVGQLKLIEQCTIEHFKLQFSENRILGTCNHEFTDAII